MATDNDKEELKTLMRKLKDSIQDYLDNIDMDEADEKKAKKEKEKK